LIYKTQEDIIEQYSENEVELRDRVSIYYFDNIDLTLFYSDAYSQWSKEDHYALKPIDIDKFKEVKLDKQEEKGILKCIFI